MICFQAKLSIFHLKANNHYILYIPKILSEARNNLIYIDIDRSSNKTLEKFGSSRGLKKPEITPISRLYTTYQYEKMGFLKKHFHIKISLQSLSGENRQYTIYSDCRDFANTRQANAQPKRLMQL